MVTWVSDNRKIGIGLVGFGSLFLALGILLFFDRGLLALGNLLLLAGIILLIGTRKALHFFTKRQKLRGTICFGIGIVLILTGMPTLGMLVECFGIFNLFWCVIICSCAGAIKNYLFDFFFFFSTTIYRNFFPMCISVLHNVPGIGSLMDIPAVSSFLYRISGSESSYRHNTLPTSQSL